MNFFPELHSAREFPERLPLAALTHHSGTPEATNFHYVTEMRAGFRVSDVTVVEISRKACYRRQLQRRTGSSFLVFSLFSLTDNVRKGNRMTGRK